MLMVMYEQWKALINRRERIFVTYLYIFFRAEINFLPDPVDEMTSLPIWERPLFDIFSGAH